MDRGDVLDVMHQHLSHKYQSLFFFYFAKGVNHLLRSHPHSSSVILFNDLQFLDDNQEFLKRFYRRDEAPARIQILADYFDKARILPQETPTLVSPTATKCMQKRNKRYVKMHKRREEQNNEWDQNLDYAFQQYVHSVHTSVMGESSEVDQRIEISYQTDVYDVYGEGERGVVNVQVERGILSLPTGEEEKEEALQLQEPRHLVCDFGSLQKSKLQPQLRIDLKRLRLACEMCDANNIQQVSKENINKLLPSERGGASERAQASAMCRQIQLQKEDQSIINRYRKMGKKPNLLLEENLKTTQRDRCYYPLTSTPYSSNPIDKKQPQPQPQPQSQPQSQPQPQLVKTIGSPEKDHLKYFKLLEKAANKHTSSQESVWQLFKKTKPRFKEEEISPRSPSRLETLKYKALKLIGDSKALREAKSSDPTVRNR